MGLADKNNIIRSDKKTGRLPEAILMAKPGEGVNVYEVPCVNGKTMMIACRLCEGMVKGEMVYGGFVPFFSLGKHGDLIESTAVCSCVIGKYREKILKHRKQGFIRYVDLPTAARPECAKDKHELSMFNLRTKYAFLAGDIKKENMVSFDEIVKIMESKTVKEKEESIAEIAGKIGVPDDDPLPF